MTIGRVVEMSSSTVPILLAALLEVLIPIIAIDTSWFHSHHPRDHPFSRPLSRFNNC